MTEERTLTIEKTAWCSAEKVSDQLTKLELDIKLNEGIPKERQKKLKYLEELKSFVNLINASRKNVVFCLSDKVKGLRKAIEELNILFNGFEIRPENCDLVPKKYANKICVLRVQEKSLVLIKVD